MRISDWSSDVCSSDLGIDGDDAPGLRLHRALDHRQAQRAEAEHRDTVAGLYLRRVVHGPDAGGNAAAEQADLLRRRLLVRSEGRRVGKEGVSPGSARWSP